MNPTKKRIKNLPNQEQRGNYQEVSKSFDLEMKLIRNINSGKPPSSALDEE